MLDDSGSIQKLLCDVMGILSETKIYPLSVTVSDEVMP